MTWPRARRVSPRQPRLSLRSVVRSRPAAPVPARHRSRRRPPLRRSRHHRQETSLRSASAVSASRVATTARCRTWPPSASSTPREPASRARRPSSPSPSHRRSSSRHTVRSCCGNSATHRRCPSGNPEYRRDDRHRRHHLQHGTTAALLPVQSQTSQALPQGQASDVGGRGPADLCRCRGSLRARVTCPRHADPAAGGRPSSGLPEHVGQLKSQ